VLSALKTFCLIGYISFLIYLLACLLTYLLTSTERKVPPLFVDTGTNSIPGELERNENIIMRTAGGIIYHMRSKIKSKSWSMAKLLAGDQGTTFACRSRLSCKHYCIFLQYFSHFISNHLIDYQCVSYYRQNVNVYRSIWRPQ